MEIELVAFAVLDTLTDREETSRLCRDLTEGRYQLIGGSPNHDSRPRDSIVSMMELAVRTGLEVDVHIDETLDPTRLLMDFALDEVGTPTSGRTGIVQPLLPAERTSRTADPLPRPAHGRAGDNRQLPAANQSDPA